MDTWCIKRLLLGPHSELCSLPSTSSYLQGRSFPNICHSLLAIAIIIDTLLSLLFNTFVFFVPPFSAKIEYAQLRQIMSIHPRSGTAYWALHWGVKRGSSREEDESTRPQKDSYETLTNRGAQGLLLAATSAPASCGYRSRTRPRQHRISPETDDWVEVSPLDPHYLSRLSGLAATLLSHDTLYSAEHLVHFRASSAP